MILTSLGLVLVALCLVIGSGFVMVGIIGLLKFNDPMTRLHAPTKVGTMGIGMLLLASMLNGLVQGDPSFHELLIMAFLFVTAPISANFLAKVNIHNRTGEAPPAPDPKENWGTFATPPIDKTEPTKPV